MYNKIKNAILLEDGSMGLGDLSVIYDDDSILWGDMSDTEYFTLYFDEIKFDYPHQATVKAHIDYGVRTVDMVYGMHH